MRLKDTDYYIECKISFDDYDNKERLLAPPLIYKLTTFYGIIDSRIIKLNSGIVPLTREFANDFNSFFTNNDQAYIYNDILDSRIRSYLKSIAGEHILKHRPYIVETIRKDMQDGMLKTLESFKQKRRDVPYMARTELNIQDFPEHDFNRDELNKSLISAMGLAIQCILKPVYKCNNIHCSCSIKDKNMKFIQGSADIISLKPEDTQWYIY